MILVNLATTCGAGGLVPFVHLFARLISMSTLSLFRSGPLVLRALHSVIIKSCNYSTPRNAVFPIPRITRGLSSTKATNDEEAAARVAAADANNSGPTIFDKIISKEIPSSIVYEDEDVLAFRDINPQAPVHVLLIPKLRDGLTELGKAEKRHEEILGRLLYAARVVAEKEGIIDGFRVVINSGPSACQSVYHLHLHVLGGRQMKWPPG